MTKFFSKIAASGVFIIISLFNEIEEFLQAINKYGIKNMFVNIHIGWGDLLFRVILTTLVWLFYKDYLKYKKISTELFASIEAENKILRAGIRSLRAITKNDDLILMDLWIESRNRNNSSLQTIAEELSAITGKKISSQTEHPEITVYKEKLNDKMEAEMKIHEDIVDNI